MNKNANNTPPVQIDVYSQLCVCVPMRHQYSATHYSVVSQFSSAHVHYLLHDRLVVAPVAVVDCTIILQINLLIKTTILFLKNSKSPQKRRDNVITCKSQKWQCKISRPHECSA
jgi:hypothetical protein